MSHQELSPHQAYYDAVLEKALLRFDDRVGKPFATTVKISCVDDPDFWAFATREIDHLQLDIARGTLDRIQQVWRSSLELSAALPTRQQIVLLGHEDHAIETSFAWLLQHELNHQAIGHFDLGLVAALAEGNSPRGFGIVRRGSQAKSVAQSMTTQQLADAHLCLELQTDHDATEIVLGAYSNENWPLFRYYAICIIVVLFIIEAEDRRSGLPLRYHPHASTRLFMMIAHLVELPMIPGIKRAHAEGLDHLPAGYLPTADELVRFRSDVIKPVMMASQIIAKACGIPEAWDELGSVDAFFDDIDAILVDGASTREELETQGAKQWAKLKAQNSDLLKKMRW